MSRIFDLTDYEIAKNQPQADREILCSCGRGHFLLACDTQCDCGQLFNASGQRLLPQSMWEEPEDY
jgi:hypothetical protein